jgi:uncharacterized protein
MKRLAQYPPGKMIQRRAADNSGIWYFHQGRVGFLDGPEQLWESFKMKQLLTWICVITITTTCVHAQNLLTRPGGTPQDDPIGRFAAKVLGSTELQWKQVFAKDGRTYGAPGLVLYRGKTQSSCGGVAKSTMGRSIVDQKIYLDTSFFDQIATRFRGCDVGNKACQFSQAYVIARLVGHHVQNLLGILPRAQQAQRAADSKAAANHIQMQVDLQADCLAGIWANRENEMLKSEGKPAFIEPGDIEAALSAASGGDITVQRQRWFNTGFRSGSVASCNTFAARQL